MSLEAHKKYFLENDRIESYKSWPFSNEQKCSVKKVTSYEIAKRNVSHIKICVCLCVSIRNY